MYLIELPFVKTSTDPLTPTRAAVRSLGLDLFFFIVQPIM